jgi:hypothetical protein
MTNGKGRLLKSSEGADLSRLEYFDRLSCSCRRKFPCSNAVMRRRFVCTWLGCQCSGRPLAMRRGVPRLRRQVLRHIEHKLSPQPSFTPPCPTSAPELRMTIVLNSAGTAGQARMCGRNPAVPPQTAFPTIFRPASGARNAAPLRYSSQGTPLGMKPLTENPFMFLIFILSNNFQSEGFNQ